MSKIKYSKERLENFIFIFPLFFQVNEKLIETVVQILSVILTQSDIGYQKNLILNFTKMKDLNNFNFMQNHFKKVITKEMDPFKFRSLDGS